MGNIGPIHKEREYEEVPVPAQPAEPIRTEPTPDKELEPV